MPELSRFYGIVVRMYFDDDQRHSLPHVHVYYGSMDASYSLRGKLLGGEIPPKQEKLLLPGWPFTNKNSFAFCPLDEPTRWP